MDPHTHGRPTGAAASRLYEGEEIAGGRTWGAAVDGTQKYRKHPIELSGNYTLAWQDYSRVAVQRGGLFRRLVLEIR